MMAPMPTAPMGAAPPNWPITPVSTAPKIGTVALEITIGRAIDKTRRCVMPYVGSAITLRHQEMSRCLREEAISIVLPSLDMHRSITPARTVDPCPCIGIARQAGTQVVNGKINGFWQDQGAVL